MFYHLRDYIEHNDLQYLVSEGVVWITLNSLRTIIASEVLKREVVSFNELSKDEWAILQDRLDELFIAREVMRLGWNPVTKKGVERVYAQALRRVDEGRENASTAERFREKVLLQLTSHP